MAIYVSSGMVYGNQTIVDDTVFVLEGGETYNVTADKNGSINVSSGGAATSTVLNRYAAMCATGSGAQLTSTTLNYGAVLQLGSSAYADTTVVNSALMYVSGNGQAAYTTLNGGVMFVSNGGVASSTTANTDGWIVVRNGGVAEETVITGGMMLVYAGGSISDTLVGPNGSMTMMGGSADGTIVSDGGSILILNDAEVCGTIVAADGLAKLAGGLATDITVTDGGELTVGESGKVTGTLSISADATVTFLPGSILDFDISTVAADELPLVDDLSLVGGTPDFTITIAAAQAKGTYSLAEGATGFAETVTVFRDDGTELGALSVGSALSVDDYTYILDLDDSLLSLAVSGIFKPGDLNADGRADIIMTISEAGNDAEGATGAWLIQSDDTAAWGDLSRRDAGWSIFGIGRTDTLKATNDVYLKSENNVVGAWTTDPVGAVDGWVTIGEFDADTQVLGLGDFSRNGQTDLLLRNVNGAVGCYLTADSSWNYFQSIGEEWTIAAIGDLNGDGLDDVVLKHEAGFAGSWLTQADLTVAWADLDTLEEGFTIVGTGDFDGDGTDDVLLQNGTYFGAWRVRDGSVSSWMGLGDFGEATVEQIADFDGDGIDDLRLRTSDGDLGAQLVQGEDNTKWAYYGSVGAGWSTALAAL